MMRCSLDGSNARVISKGFQSLSKFGTDLFIEADQYGFKLAALNSMRTAVGSFKFSKNFFQTYNITEGSAFYYKVSMKTCLAVFRNMKHVEKCDFFIDADQHKFNVQLKCRFEIVKNAVIPILDDENITASQSPEDTLNIILGSHRVFAEISAHFNTVEEEITLEAFKGKLAAMNYIEGARVNDRFMRSRLKLDPVEFESYKITRESTVTFCLREFRSFLLFTEVLNENLQITFSAAGNPIYVKSNKLDEIECVLIMSTLSPEDISYYDDVEKGRMDTDDCIENTTIIADKNPENCFPLDEKINRSVAGDTTLSNDSAMFQFEKSDDSSNLVEQLRLAPSINNNNDIITDINQCELQAPTMDCSLIFQDSEQIMELPLSTVDDNTEVIQQSPDKLQLRSIFSRCFESTYIPKEPSPNSHIYVPDSDTED